MMSVKYTKKWAQNFPDTVFSETQPCWEHHVGCPEVNGKVKITLEQPWGPEREQMYSSFFNLGARCGWVVNATPQPFYLRKRPGSQCTGVLLVPTAGLHGYGCEPRTVHPAASRYTDWAIPAHGHVKISQQHMWTVNTEVLKLSVNKWPAPSHYAILCAYAHCTIWWIDTQT